MKISPETIRHDLYVTRDRKKGYYVFLQERYRCYRKKDDVWRLRLPGACSAIVYQETPEIRKDLPEEYRGAEFTCIMIYARSDVTEGRTVNERIYEEPDLLFDSGKEPWKVVRTKHWEDYDFYQARAVRRRDGTAA